MNIDEMKGQLESRLMIIIKNFEGQQVTQDFIDKIWAATQDEVRFFNEEHMRLPIPAANWLHTQYVNRFVTLMIAGKITTIGEMVTFDNPPTLTAVPLVDLYRMRSMFEHTPLVEDIDLEIKGRLKTDGKTDKQAS